MSFNYIIAAMWEIVFSKYLDVSIVNFFRFFQTF